MTSANRSDSSAFEIDTDSLPAADRIEFWRAHVCDRFVELAVEPTSRAVRGRVAGLSVAETRIRRIRASQHIFERRVSDIRASDPEVLHIVGMVDGRALIEQDDRSVLLKPGDLALYDSSRPFKVQTPGPFQFTVGLIPKRLLPMSPESLVTRTARATTPDSVVGAALGSLLTSLAGGRAIEAGADQQVALQHALVSLFVAFTSDEGTAGGPPSVHLALAKSFSAKHLGRPGLAPGDIAAACGVSQSYLHRLFANDGLTVAGHLRELRLQGAWHDLTTSLRDEPIAVVAARWGMPNPAHFTRAFRSRFGVPPSEARRLGPRTIQERSRRG